MARVLVAALVAMIISILAGPKFIDFLRRNEFGQHIREEVGVPNARIAGATEDQRKVAGLARRPDRMLGHACRRPREWRGRWDQQRSCRRDTARVSRAITLSLELRNCDASSRMAAIA